MHHTLSARFYSDYCINRNFASLFQKSKIGVAQIFCQVLRSLVVSGKVGGVGLLRSSSMLCYCFQPHRSYILVHTGTGLCVYEVICYELCAAFLF